MRRPVDMAATLLRPVEAAVIPRICPVCRSRTVETLAEDVCGLCRAALPPVPEPHCPACGGVLDGVLTVCSECMRLPPRPWRQAVSAFLFQGVVRDVIHRYKYNGDTALAPVLGRRMARAWLQRGAAAPDVIVPVPLHWTREAARGFNQAELLAREVGRILAVPVKCALRRVRRTPKQARLDADERRRNMADAFRVGRDGGEAADRLVMLVDDVLTTGATIEAAANALLDAGARAVVVLTAARG